MIGFEAAGARVASMARPLGTERVALATAHGRTLAVSVCAERDSPPVAVSAMDGYAVRTADLASGRARLRIIGESFAGAAYSGAVRSGTCVRTFTGAQVPEGADRVVIQETVQREGAVAVFGDPPAERTHIRPAGSDFGRGALLAPAGARLTPQRLVAVAAADVAEVEVWRRPRVAILTTGDELVQPGRARCRPQAVPESVSFGVAALAEVWGGEVIGRCHCGDDFAALSRAAAEAVEAADVVIVTGGASVGERDYARAMFEPLGLELLFSKVAMKPGKPIWMGQAGGAYVVGLPGNPTSAHVTARLFLAPLLAGLGGGEPAEAWRWRRLPLTGPLGPCSERETFYRAQLAEDGVGVMDDQNSASQGALGAADALVRRRPGAPAAAAAEPVEVLEL